MTFNWTDNLTLVCKWGMYAIMPEEGVRFQYRAFLNGRASDYVGTVEEVKAKVEHLIRTNGIEWRSGN